MRIFAFVALLAGSVAVAADKPPVRMDRADAFELKASLLEEAARRRQLEDLLAPLLKRREELLRKYAIDPVKDRVDLEKDVGKIDRPEKTPGPAPKK